MMAQRRSWHVDVGLDLTRRCTGFVALDHPARPVAQRGARFWTARLLPILSKIRRKQLSPAFPVYDFGGYCEVKRVRCKRPSSIATMTASTLDETPKRS